MSFSISGKTAIVTGSSSGIGLAVARRFVEAGANVMCADLDETALAENFGSSNGEPADNLRYFAGDLRQKLTITNLISATIDAFDQVDILINAARVFAPTDALDPGDKTALDLVESNMATALRLSQHVAKRMIKRASAEDRGEETLIGSIVNLSSSVVTQTRPELMGYSIAAASVNQMTKSLALALAPSRIRVNAVALGSVMSASMQAALKESPDWREEIEEMTPLGRIGSPADLTDVVQFLASDASAFMTGQVICVDGGRSLVDPISVPAH